MGRIYNEALDSIYFSIAGSTNASLSYYVNWDAIMPQGAYKMTWSYNSDVNAYPPTDIYVMGLALSLGANSCYSVNKFSTNSTTFIGFTQIIPFGTSSYMFANQNTNPPIYLPQRPSQNTVLVQHCNGIDTTSSFSSPIPVSYVLTLSFEAVD